MRRTGLSYLLAIWAIRPLFVWLGKKKKRRSYVSLGSLQSFACVPSFAEQTIIPIWLLRIDAVSSDNEAIIAVLRSWKNGFWSVCFTLTLREEQLACSGAFLP